MLMFDAAAVHAALTFDRLADALRDAFARGAAVPLRHAHDLGGGDRLLLMPAWTAQSLGVKVVTVMPQAAAQGARTVAAVYLLLDRATGAARACIDGEALTLRRTGTCSALAARHLARADASRLLVVGTGALAPMMARAHAALRPALREIVIWGRDHAKAQAMATALARDGLPARAAVDLRVAVEQAHIVCCATTAREPVIAGRWLAPGTHVDLVGGFTPAMREVDDDAIARAVLYVDTRQGALAEAGDLTQPIARGVITADAVRGELAQLVRGEVRGRADDQQITLFKSVGTALADLAAARLVVGDQAGGAVSMKL